MVPGGHLQVSNFLPRKLSDDKYIIKGKRYSNPKSSAGPFSAIAASKIMQDELISPELMPTDGVSLSPSP